jgi:hypothetical protein
MNLIANFFVEKTQNSKKWFSVSNIF